MYSIKGQVYKRRYITLHCLKMIQVYFNHLIKVSRQKEKNNDSFMLIKQQVLQVTCYVRCFYIFL